MPSPSPPSSKRRPGGMTILHEDRDILVVIKPSGLLTIGTDRDKTRTAHYLLNDYVRKGNPKSPNRVYVVHRLDRETSGVLVFARSEAAKAHLQTNWEQAEKTYLAVVHGRLIPKEGTISTHLVENAALKVYSTPDPARGKLSITDYRVVAEARGLSLVEIALRTGRKHQIRVHFAERGHPLVGDDKYGKPADRFPRLALHARSLSFIHPTRGERLTFSAEMPPEFGRLMKLV